MTPPKMKKQTKAATWRTHYRGRLLNLRFPSQAAMERVRRASRSEKQSINSFVSDAAIKAAEEILKPKSLSA